MPAACNRRRALPRHHRLRSRPHGQRRVDGAARPHRRPGRARPGVGKPQRHLQSACPTSSKRCGSPGSARFSIWSAPRSQSLLPRRGEMPNIVFLTPGFRHPSYFEHAYKARLLGFPLVEPADLTVRERRLVSQDPRRTAPHRRRRLPHRRRRPRPAGTLGPRRRRRARNGRSLAHGKCRAGQRTGLRIRLQLPR